MVEKLPKAYASFAEELPDLPATRAVPEKYLKADAIDIREQKFGVDADLRRIDLAADLA